MTSFPEICFNLVEKVLTVRQMFGKVESRIFVPELKHITYDSKHKITHNG
jgi:hypothetical protein